MFGDHRKLSALGVANQVTRVFPKIPNCERLYEDPFCC